MFLPQCERPRFTPIQNINICPVSISLTPQHLLVFFTVPLATCLDICTAITTQVVPLQHCATQYCHHHTSRSPTALYHTHCHHHTSHSHTALYQSPTATLQVSARLPKCPQRPEALPLLFNAHFYSNKGARTSLYVHLDPCLRMTAAILSSPCTS
jgi:hypothetical protein